MFNFQLINRLFSFNQLLDNYESIEVFTAVASAAKPEFCKYQYRENKCNFTSDCKKMNSFQIPN